MKAPIKRKSSLQFLNSKSFDPSYASVLFENNPCINWVENQQLWNQSTDNFCNGINNMPLNCRFYEQPVFDMYHSNMNFDYVNTSWTSSLLSHDHSDAGQTEVDKWINMVETDDLLLYNFDSNSNSKSNYVHIDASDERTHNDPIHNTEYFDNRSPGYWSQSSDLSNASKLSSIDDESSLDLSYDCDSSVSPSTSIDESTWYSSIQESTTSKQKIPKKRRTKPDIPKNSRKMKKARDKKSAKQWELLVYILHRTERYGNIAVWVNHRAGEFKIVDLPKLVSLWLRVKKTGCTDKKGDNFLRGLRHYYADDLLTKMSGRKGEYVYRFGSNAQTTCWRSGELRDKAANSLSLALSE